MDTTDSYESNTYGKLLKLTSNDANIIRHKWHEPVIGANTLKISSRTINYFETIGLINDPRGDNRTGWRKFSYVEAVYLLIARELRHYGVHTRFIKAFYDTYVKPNDDEFTDAILLAHLGYKITITIESDQTERILGMDELLRREHEESSDLRPSEIRLNLAYFSWKVDSLIRGQNLANEVAEWFRNSLDDEALEPLRHDLNLQENMLIDRFRQTKPGESFTIKRSNSGETFTEHTQSVKIDDKLDKTLADIAGGFGEITIRMSGGKAVKGIVKESTKL